MLAQDSIAVLSIVGRSKTGKTTLIEKLIPLLKSRGLTIATIKHHHGDFEIDREGKDTYRHKAAGAKAVLLTSPAKIALVMDVDKELKVQEIINKYIHDVDLVITEGYKRESFPKIEVFNWKKDTYPVCLGDGSLIALVVDKRIDVTVQQFLRDDIAGIAEFILNFVKRKT
ncbi:MAG TPA: molybdopterin-guanine dinucleotide biosynthesis protein B [Syntrophorhabdaceae bacterium]|nr:molybdopterin-guanine dinucleotide biosynthesis protein B [Syntrophorhabdaceae bacterium]HQM80869.1 molybdopterin-guanine dinucleotide biosynthesis protein B [Syntrophorhabdaceae bacterium]